jgi:4-amino-4-deoxy-L-arabinose transferase-like glycosyltransferase
MEQKSFFASSRLTLALTLFLLFGVALAIRLYDITDLPLDFHPTRQLFSAVKARGMYYETLPDVPEWQREFAVQQWKTKVTIEPELLERLAAYIYRYTGEQLWIPRLISSLFWLVGGIFVYLLARDMLSVDGAVLALAFYLFVPYGIFASRSFQPDPLMVALIVAFWWLIYRWANSPLPGGEGPGEAPDKGVRAGWKWAILAGLTGGLAIFVKFVAAFLVIGGALGFLLGRFKLRELLRNPQVWMLGVLGVLPGGAWIIYGKFVAGLFGGDMSGRFIPSLLASPLFYVQWQAKAAVVAGGIGIMLGLLGMFIIREKGRRAFLFGIWGAYLVFGLYFNYHISTHDYYSLPLIAIVALSLAPLGDWFFARLTGAGPGWVRSAILVVLMYGLFSTVWVVRNEMKSVDYRPQAAYWAEIREALRGQGSVVALTEDYGNRLTYWGWRKATLWPSYGDLYQADVRGNRRDIEKLFTEMAAQKTYFLVTDLEDFAKQKDLQALLAGYPVLVQGDGYMIYDLQRPLEAQL